ncbi:unnamed protein product [Acanthocheilonema viteae]|uniref:Uncharacterized protein n=1 Tax=Acanthocheilonema viteae TaxID=6277 RepID=A0A498S3V3_ACAVI|nr:unnamed protein product [Acanthocheilonema viteae]
MLGLQSSNNREEPIVKSSKSALTLQYAEQCPTCRTHTSPSNIVKRLYFANCDDKTVNDVGTSSIAAVTDHNKSASITNENARSSQAPENINEFDGNYHDNGKNYNNNSGYDSDYEDEANRAIDGDFTDSSDLNMTPSEDSEFATESEDKNEELEYQETISDSDVVSVLNAPLSITSSVSLGSFAESFGEIDDTLSVSSLEYDNMEISESLDDHDEISNDGDNIFTSGLLIEHDSNDDDSFSSDDSDNGNSDSDLYNYDHFAPHLRMFNQFILPYPMYYDVRFQFLFN